jgi:hypothetical protein
MLRSSLPCSKPVRPNLLQALSALSALSATDFHLLASDADWLLLTALAAGRHDET